MNNPLSIDGFTYDLHGIARQYMRSRIFLTAIELNVFKELYCVEITASDLAKKIGGDERATEILLNALVGMELLQKKENMYGNVQSMADLMEQVGPENLHGIFLHTANLWDIWSDLTEVIKSGKPKPKEWAHNKSVNLALMMQQQAKKMAFGLVDLVDCTYAKNMLDLGSGPGTYAIAFAKRNPGLKVVCFDSDEQANLFALEEIRKHQLQDRISTVKGDLLVDDFGVGYDLIFLSSVICLLGKENIICLFSKIRQALNEDGRIVIWDLISDESNTLPGSTSIFAVNMLLTTQNGKAYSFSEIHNYLQTTGFKDIYRIPYSKSQIIVGGL